MVISDRTYEPRIAPVPRGYSGAWDVLKNCGPMMLDTQYETNIMALTVTFLVWPYENIQLVSISSISFIVNKTYSCVGSNQTQCHNIRAEIEERHPQRSKSTMQSIQRQRIQENSGYQSDNDAKHDRDTAEMILWIELEGQEDTAVANIT